ETGPRPSDRGESPRTGKCRPRRARLRLPSCRAGYWPFVSRRIDHPARFLLNLETNQRKFGAFLEIFYVAFVAPRRPSPATSALVHVRRRTVMLPNYLASALAVAVLGLAAAPAAATTLTMENVINRVPGTGPAGENEGFFTFGFYQPNG